MGKLPGKMGGPLRWTPTGSEEDRREVGGDTRMSLDRNETENQKVTFAGDHGNRRG